MLGVFGQVFVCVLSTEGLVWVLVFLVVLGGDWTGVCGCLCCLRVFGQAVGSFFYDKQPFLDTYF